MAELIKTWDIPGGIHPAQNKSQSLQLPLGCIDLPPQLILPLSQHIGAPAQPIVNVGDKVFGGQIIASANGIFSVNIHAPTSGIISAIDDHLIAHSSGMNDTCITIDTDGNNNWVTLTETPDYQSLSKEVLLEKIRAAGLAGLGGAGFPTAVKLNPRANQTIDTLIINGTECEPYITADDILMRTHARDIIAGTLLLAQLLDNPSRIIIGVEDNKPEAVATLQTAAVNTPVEVVPFPTKYPSGGEKQLIYIITGREVPSGQIPANIGVVCQNVGTTYAAYRAVRFGEPLTKRITTVVGESLDIQRNIEVLFGTPMNFVLAQHGFHEDNASRLIMGGPMMGFTVPDASVPVVKTTNCILAPTTKELPTPTPAQACIRCGMCAEACPASLLPQQLFWYAQSEDTEKLNAYNLFDCIECGACSFVCPSHIPLVQYYRAAKGSIRQHDAEKESSDRSRKRFEFRQLRIDKENEAKEAKRAARKEAAAAAKKKLAEKKLQEASANTNIPAADKVTPKIVPPRKPAPAITPEKQRAKLERTLAGAKSRLEKAEKTLDTPTPEQQEKQKAGIKQAELKISKAQEKLDAFNNTLTPKETQENTAVKEATKVEVKGIDTDAETLTAAIVRAQEKVFMSSDEKHEASLNTLKLRLEKAEQKAAEALEEGQENAETLSSIVEKLQEKLKLAQLEPVNPVTNKASEKSNVKQVSSTKKVTTDAASAAIEKAKKKAQALADMSVEDKLKNNIESLEKRLKKAQVRLTKAESENNDNIDAFKTGVTKLEEKLATALSQLEQL